jgi:hypothetical protein
LISASSTREAPRTVASALPGPSSPYIDTSPRSRNNPPSPTDPSLSPFQPKTGDRSVFAFSSQCPISAIACAICREPKPTDLCPLTFQLGLQVA